MMLPVVIKYFILTSGLLTIHSLYYLNFTNFAVISDHEYYMIYIVLDFIVI